MRIKNGFVLREVGGQYAVIATGEASQTFHGMVKLNESGKDVWQAVTDGLELDAIVDLFVDKYGIERQQAQSDIEKMLSLMEQEGFLVK